MDLSVFFLLRSWQLFIIYKLKIIHFLMTPGRPGVGVGEFLKNFHPSLLFVEGITNMPLFLSHGLPRSGSFQIDYCVLNPLITAIISYQSFQPKGQSFRACFKVQTADSCQSRPPDCGAVVILSPKIIPFCLFFFWPKVRLELELKLGLRAG